MESLPPVTLARKSDNSKLGPISATYASQSSCPRSCPLYGNGCYAEQGPLGWHTARLNKSDVVRADSIARAESALIDTLDGSRDLRLHVVGDARTPTSARILAAAVARFLDRSDALGTDARAFTYTHAWRDVPRSAWGRTSVLASCERPEDVTTAHDRGYATALVVEHFRQASAYDLTPSVRLLPCPAQTRDDVQCADCRLCMNADRLRSAGLTIGFEAHGVQRKRVLASLPVLS